MAQQRDEPAGGVESEALRQKTNPALVAPDDHAGAAETEVCLMEKVNSYYANGSDAPRSGALP